MRSAADDRTARAAIRDEALRLFAAQGPDAVTVRQVAAAAGVSPGWSCTTSGRKPDCERRWMSMSWPCSP